MKVYATYNAKGGVGKTSTCVTLAYLAAGDGLRTLIWDLDPQGAAAWIYRVGMDARACGARCMASGAFDLAAAVRASDHENLDLLPVDESLRELDLELEQAGGDSRRLGGLLSSLSADYDVVFIDAAPALSRVAENVFAASDALLTPTIPTPLSLRTLARLLLHLKQRSSRPRVLPFFTMVDRRKALHRQVAEYAEDQGLGFLRTEIPYSSAVERMSVVRRPLHAFAGGDRAARAYRALWDELRARMSAQPARPERNGKPREPGDHRDDGGPSRERVAALLAEVRAAAGSR